MATTKRKKKNSGKPTAKQLAARRKFARMAKSGKLAQLRNKSKATARVARKNCDGRTRKNKTVIKAKRAVVVKPNRVRKVKATGRAKAINRGMLLSGRKNSTARRRRNAESRSSAAPIEVKRHFRAGPPGYMTPWQRAEKAGQQRLFKMNRSPKRRSNSSTPPAVQELHSEFIGRVSKRFSEVDAPGNAPVDLVKAGTLTQLKTSKETFNFTEAENVALAIGTSGNLYVVGKINPPLEKNADFGKLRSVSYVTAKPHLTGGQKYEWVHKFGEDGGEQPTLVSDGDGRFRIVGGDYYVTPEGIAD
jgi:hypothetical protein